MFEFETHMDFVGQHKAEKLSRVIITLFGVVGLVWGGIAQQFSLTVYTLGVGLVLASILTIPPWPYYRRNPIKWQKPRQITETNETDDVSGKKKKK